MLPLPLEPTDERAKPPFKDANSCKKWLDQLQFTNLPAALATLRTQIDELNRCPVRGLDRMQALETLRETVHFVQGDYTKRLAGKPLPFDDSELAILTAATSLWQSLFTGYLRCLQSLLGGDKQLAPFGALICHRALSYSGLQIFEHLRAGYEFEGVQWQQLHALYTFAEEQNLLAAEVEDRLNERDRRSSCRNSYVRALLACHARPHELTRTQQQRLELWLSHWVTTITVDHTFTISKGDAPPLAIDLTSTQGLQPVKEGMQGNDPTMRYLAMVPLSKLLRVKTILLQQGHTPQQLELGDGFSSTDCMELLGHLHKCWCEPRPPRGAERYGATQETQLCYGLEDIFSCLANQPFDTKKKPVQEAWRAEDISMLGARLLRTSQEGLRLSANRIVAARIGGDQSFRLGYIVWLGVTRDKQLHMGLRFFPGTPGAAALKDAAPAAGAANPRNAAVLLPAMPDYGVPASLVVPRNLFQPDRVMEVAVTPGGEKMKVKLGFSVEKGVDYERVSFTPM